MREGKILQLDQIVANPHPDGRKRNWTGEKMFQPGRYILDYSGIIYRRGESRYNRLSPYENKEGIEAICKASSTVEPKGISEVLATFDASESERSILGVMLYLQVISQDDIKAAVEALEANDALYDLI